MAEVMIRAPEAGAFHLFDLKLPNRNQGHGFPDDVLNLLGEPYIKSKISTNQSGLGLGTFLGKTLLNRKSAKVMFDNNSSLKGARVSIQWNIKDLNVSS